MKLTESTEMLKEAERQGAVKIMIPVSELKFMLQQVLKVEEMQKAFEGIHRIASETFESHNQLELIRLTAVEHLKGGETK